MSLHDSEVRVGAVLVPGSCRIVKTDHGGSRVADLTETVMSADDPKGMKEGIR